MKAYDRVPVVGSMSPPFQLAGWGCLGYALAALFVIAGVDRFTKGEDFILPLILVWMGLSLFGFGLLMTLRCLTSVRLDAEGVTIAAEILDLEEGIGRDRPCYAVFRIPEIGVVKCSVDKPVYDSLNWGDRIYVRYLPQNPVVLRMKWKKGDLSDD